MITSEDLARFLRPFTIRLQTMVGRAVLLAVDNTAAAQRVRIKLNGDEIIEQIERLQEYGLETNPPIEDTSEAVILSIGGSRELSFVTRVQARALRPVGLKAGEVKLWSKFGQYVYFKEDGSIEIAAAGKDVNVSACANLLVTATTKVTLTAPSVELSDGTLRQLIDERLVTEFNSHTHTGNLGAPTSTPIVPLVLVNVATEKTKAG